MTLEEIRAEILHRIEAAEATVREAYVMRRALEAELYGFDRAMKAMKEACAEPAQSRERRSVQEPVMALFINGMVGKGFRSEDEIAVVTGLPESSVHTFLLRAVREGRLAVDKDGLYRLPSTGMTEGESSPVNSYESEDQSAVSE